MLLLAPRARLDVLQARAEAIRAATPNRIEQVILLVIDFKETSFSPRANYPFGLTCCHRPWWTLAQDAAMSLRIYREGLRRCGSLEGSFRYYNTGECCVGRLPHGRVARARWRRGRAYGRALLHTMGYVQHPERGVSAVARRPGRQR